MLTFDPPPPKKKVSQELKNCTVTMAHELKSTNILNFLISDGNKT